MDTATDQDAVALAEIMTRTRLIDAVMAYQHARALVSELPPLTPLAVTEWAEEQLVRSGGELADAAKHYAAALERPGQEST